jgi:hypothetical protein
LEWRQKGKPGSAASTDNIADAPGRSEIQSAYSPRENIRLVMEQLQALHTRMDEHAKTQSELLRQNALRDHPVAIHNNASTTLVDTPDKLTWDFVHPPQRKQTPQGGNRRRLTIDPYFVAQTAD